jgi:hypothetical protein
MRKTLKMLFVVSFMLLMSWNSVGATVLDFESLDPGGGNMTALYQEDGYTLTNNAASVFNNQGITEVSFGWWATNHTNYAGSLGLYTNYWPLTVTLTRDNNTLFDMYSIDLSRMGLLNQYGAPGIRSVIFAGTKSDDTAVTQTFTYGEVVAFQTFLFNSDFKDLKSLSWAPASQTMDVNGVGLQYYQFDNITMYPLSNPVPIPAAVWLFGTGLLGLFGLRRKIIK